ncbi:NADPH-dependent F420 reductase [Pollutimonas subterranea]|uniref:NADPH-dependent F420 reductase n=1 Tax=Pollutimonas subterranea TaxID=2045210 RepID=UPI0034E235E7
MGAGHRTVLSNSRAPEKLAGVIGRLGSGASAAPVAIAAEKPLVLLAVPWSRVEAALRGLAEWQGRILIDATNTFRDGTPAQGLVDFHGGSSSEHVAASAPGARIVKAMNTLFMCNFAAEAREGRFRRAAFVSEASQRVDASKRSVGRLRAMTSSCLGSRLARYPYRTVTTGGSDNE